MLEMVTSSVMGEAMSGMVSFVFSSHGEKASQEILMERLEMAHLNLSTALVRSRMIPITIMQLLCKKKKLKEVFEECDDLLGKARDRQQVVPSLRRKIMHVVLPSFIVPNQDVLTSSVVGRFEWFAKEADKFVRDVESGCSLSHYRFLSSLTRHLLVGKSLSYRKVQGTQICSLWIWTASVEEYGRVARLSFGYKDSNEPLKCFHFILILRLYESTDIVGVGIKCLQSLGPQFKSLGDIATGELTQVPTQDISYYDPVSWKDVDLLTTGCCPDPFCCIPDGLNKPHASNSIAFELTLRFPQEIMLVGFDCRFSASECCAQSSTDEACINTIKSWPPLVMSATFTPHDLSPEFRYGSSLRKIEEGIQTKAIDYFIRRPELTEYDMFWDSAHGCALFRVSKPITRTRRVSKRRR